MKASAFLCCTLMIVSIPAWTTVPDPLPWANPWDVGLDYEFINQAFSEMSTAVQEENGPGAVGIVIKDGHIVARRAVGFMQRVAMKRDGEGGIVDHPAPQPMYEMTIFDLASVTKMVSTTTSVMICVERGLLELDKPVAEYIPEFGARAKDTITVRDLLTHSSGLPAWRAFYTYCTGREEVYRSIDEDIALEYKPGDKRIYSDIGFMMLGRLVGEVSGLRLDEFAEQNIFEPLGMVDTGYTPREHHRLRVAPTEFDLFRNENVKGIVHDENTRVMGGISGHAGLFSTANDLAIYAEMILNGGEFNGVRIMEKETIELMTTSQLPPAPLERGNDFLRFRTQLLGWWGMDDQMTLYYMGGLPSTAAFGHSGFTGTMIYIDPENDMAAIMLSNAVHPRRGDATKSSFYKAFYYNVSRALKGPKGVRIIGD